jgi:hypothetical protein
VKKRKNVGALTRGEIEGRREEGKEGWEESYPNNYDLKSSPRITFVPILTYSPYLLFQFVEVLTTHHRDLFDNKHVHFPPSELYF